MKKLLMRLVNLPVQRQLHIPGQNGLPIRIERARLGRTIGWRLIHGKNQFVTKDVEKVMGYLLAFRHRVVDKRPKLRMEKIPFTDLGDF